jgi:energy-coupling factor transporter ATP-binding protein EcfA2
MSKLTGSKDMYQLQEFKIVQFRKLRHLDLKGLGRINLLVGPNNSGKTSVLEAISCYCNPVNGFHWLDVALRRSGRSSGGSLIEALKWLFPQTSKSSPLEFFEGGAATLESSGEYPIIECHTQFDEFEAIRRPRKKSQGQENFKTLGESDSETGGGLARRGAELRLRIALAHNIPLSSGPTLLRQLTIWDDQKLIRRKPKGEISLPVANITVAQSQSDVVAAETFSAFRRLGLYNEAIEILRQLDSGIREVLVLSEKGRYGQLYIQHDKTGLTPLSATGDGFRRSLQIAMTIPTVKNGILLIDEIESALHVTALTRVFELLVNNCKAYNVQLFATTHSLEALDAILGTTQKINEQDLVLFRLETKDQQSTAIRLDESTLATVRNDLGQEVR